MITTIDKGGVDHWRELLRCLLAIERQQGKEKFYTTNDKILPQSIEPTLIEWPPVDLEGTAEALQGTCLVVDELTINRPQSEGWRFLAHLVRMHRAMRLSVIVLHGNTNQRFPSRLPDRITQHETYTFVREDCDEKYVTFTLNDRILLAPQQIKCPCSSQRLHALWRRRAASEYAKTMTEVKE